MSVLRVTDFPIGYRGVTANEHRSTAGGYVVASEKDTTIVQQFDFSRLQLRDQREGLHAASGGDLGVGTEVFRYLSLVFKHKGSTGEALEDRLAAYLRAFNIEEAQLDSPTTEGVSALDFYCPTAYSGTGVSSPVREKFLARPAAGPAWVSRAQDGLTALMGVELVCPDPRRYLYTATSVTLSSGAGFSNRTLPNWNTTMGRKVYPLITLTMSGNGHASLTITDGTTSLVLNMSAAGAGTFTIDMATGIIKKSTTKRADLRSSGVNTFWGVPAGGLTTVSMTNTTNVTSAVFSYNQARA